MNTTTVNGCMVSILTDVELKSEMKKCACSELYSLANFLEMVMEVDQRRLYATDGCRSLFHWLQVCFNIEEGGAYKRIAVVRKGREVPELIANIRTGNIHLSWA